MASGESRFSSPSMRTIPQHQSQRCAFGLDGFATFLVATFRMSTLASASTSPTPVLDVIGWPLQIVGRPTGDQIPVDDDILATTVAPALH